MLTFLRKQGFGERCQESSVVGMLPFDPKVNGSNPSEAQPALCNSYKNVEKFVQKLLY